MDRIGRNSTNVVCPVIDVIDDDTLEYHYRDSGGVNVGGFDWNLQFNWHAVPEHEKKKHTHTVEPVARCDEQDVSLSTIHNIFVYDWQKQ